MFGSRENPREKLKKSEGKALEKTHLLHIVFGSKENQKKKKKLLKNKPFSPPQRNSRKLNPITPYKLPNPPQNCHQPPNKLLIPMSAKPKSSPTLPPLQDLHIEIER